MWPLTPAHWLENCHAGQPWQHREVLFPPPPKKISGLEVYTTTKNQHYLCIYLWNFIVIIFIELLPKWNCKFPLSFVRCIVKLYIAVNEWLYNVFKMTVRITWFKCIIVYSICHLFWHVAIDDFSLTNKTTEHILMHTIYILIWGVD